MKSPGRGLSRKTASYSSNWLKGVIKSSDKIQCDTFLCNNTRDIFFRCLVRMLIMPVVKIHVFWVLTPLLWTSGPLYFEGCCSLFLKGQTVH